MTTTADSALESVTLRLINLVAYAAHGRGFTRRFREITGLDLPAGELRMLLALGHGASMSTSDLASMLDIDLAQASRQATNLADMGLLERSPDPADRRRSLVRVSEHGAAVTEEWRSTWVQDYLRPVLAWAQADVLALTEWLRRVDAALRKGLNSTTLSLGLPADWHQKAGLAGEDPSLRSYLATMVGLVELVALSRGFNQMLDELGSPIRQLAYFALRQIGRHGPMPISEIAQRLGVDPSQASKRVRALERHGLVDRAPDGFDGRSSRIRVSRKGSTLIRRLREFQLTGFKEVLGEVPDADRPRWTELTDRLLAAMLA